MKSDIREREQDKFRPAAGDKSKVAVTLEQDSPIPVVTDEVKWDTFEVSRPNSVTEVYDFFLGATLVQKVTLVYTSSSKKDLASGEKVTYVT